MIEVEWVDEVPKRWGPRTKPLIDAEMEAALRAHPGRWAKARTFPGSSSAHQARKRWRDNPQHLTPGEWEAEARKFPDGTSAVFMRFVGNCSREELDLLDRAWREIAGRAPDEPEPEPARRFEVFVDPARVAEPVELRTCPTCGEVKDSIAGLAIHRGRKHKGQLPGLTDGAGETLTADVVATALDEAQPPAEPAAVDEEAEEPANVGPCGPCRRGRCQFCSGHGCECRRSDHFARAPRAAAS